MEAGAEVRVVSAQAPSKAQLIRSDLLGTIYLAGPIAATLVSQQAIFVLSLRSAGVLGKQALAGAGLGLMASQIMYFASFGFLSAMDTLIPRMVALGQTYEITQVTAVSVLFTLVLSAITVVAFLASEQIFLFLQVDAGVARLAWELLLTMLPGMPAYILFTAASKLVQGYDRSIPMLVVSVLSIGPHFILNSVLVDGAILGRQEGYMGYAGIGVALSVTRNLQMFVLLIFVASARPYRQHVCGVARPSCLTAISKPIAKEFVLLGVPSSVLMVSEVGCYEIMSLLAQYISVAALAMQATMINIYVMVTVFGIAISQAASVRVGMRLASGSASNTRLTIRVILAFSIVVETLLGMTLVAALPFALPLFASDPTALEAASAAVWLVGPTLAVDAMQYVLQGIARGLGFATAPMLAGLSAYYLVAVPCAAVMIFWVKAGVEGIWIALLCGASLAFAMLATMVWRLRLSSLVKGDGPGPLARQGDWVEMAEVRGETSDHSHPNDGGASRVVD